MTNGETTHIRNRADTADLQIRRIAEELLPSR